MGYYTFFNLDAYENYSYVTTEREEEISTVLSEIVDIAFNNFGGLSYDSLKWYDHDDDMLKLSKMFPDVTFVLYGEGEERDDNWVTYYKNGDSEFCGAQIVYDRPTKDFAKSYHQY